MENGNRIYPAMAKNCRKGILMSNLKKNSGASQELLNKITGNRKLWSEGLDVLEDLKDAIRVEQQNPEHRRNHIHLIK